MRQAEIELNKEGNQSLMNATSESVSKAQSPKSIIGLRDFKFWLHGSGRGDERTVRTVKEETGNSWGGGHSIGAVEHGKLKSPSSRTVMWTRDEESRRESRRNHRKGGERWRGRRSVPVDREEDTGPGNGMLGKGINRTVPRLVSRTKQ